MTKNSDTSILLLITALLLGGIIYFIPVNYNSNNVNDWQKQNWNQPNQNQVPPEVKPVPPQKPLPPPSAKPPQDPTPPSRPWNPG
jgi:hypothetical protein